jgi:hypothetical protein
MVTRAKKRANDYGNKAMRAQKSVWEDEQDRDRHGNQRT